MARTNEWTETLVDWVDGRLRQTRFSNLWLGGGAGPNGGANYRPVDGQLTQRSVCYDTSEYASPCSPSGFSSLVDNLRRIRYWQEPATWFGVETTSGLRVTIKPGLWYPSTTEYCAFAGGDSPTFTLPGVLDRIDTVYIDPSGVLHIQHGTPAVSPTITLPPIASGIPLWAVYLPPTASGIYFQTCSGYYTGQGYIERDLRPFLNLGGTTASGVVADATAEGQALVSNAALEWVADTTPLWKGEHSFEAGIEFVGATTENSITIPDAQAQALHIIDTGGVEFLRIDTYNEFFLIDPAGVGINVGIGLSVPDLNLHVHGANSVTIKLTNDDTGIAGNVGLDIGVASDESAYMWNRENTELSFGTNNLRRVTILAAGGVGINTATIPLAGVGAAKFAIHGTDVSAAGPHIQLTTDSDDHPLLQVLADSHDDIFIFLDAYYDYASWKSSDLGSNCMLGKENDQFIIKYDSNVGQGNNITWNTGIVMNLNNGHVGIGESTPGGKLDIAWGGTGTYMTLQLGADSATYTRTNVTNKYVHMGAYHYTNIEEPVGMMYVVSTSLASHLAIGGGSGLLNAATSVSIYVAANTTTTTGTEILEITSTKFIIDPTGTGVKVGVGIATPAAEFHLHSEADETSYYISTNATNKSPSMWFIIDYDGVPKYGGMGLNHATLALGLSTTGSFATAGIILEADGDVVMKQGNVAIGLTAPVYRLDVKDDVAGSFIARFINDGDNVNRHGMIIQCGADNGAAAGTTFYIAANDGNGDSTGEIKTVAGVFQLVNTSDESRKVNIKDTEITGLGIINALKVRDYNWKANPKGPVMTGFVAQETQKVYPDMVSEMHDGTLGTSRAMLVPILAKAIQELDARLIKVEQLEIH